MKPFALALAVLCVLPALAQAQGVSGPSDRPLLSPAIPLLRPSLYVRLVKGPEGYSIGDLVKNLDWTQKNLNGLLNYLEPYSGTPAPTGEAAASAQKDLLSESAACAALIADGDAALAKGIARAPADSRLRGVLYAPMRAQTVRSKNPSLAELQRDVASDQVNVAGQMSSLIQAKGLHTPDEKVEKQIQKWLDWARKSLESSQKRLAQAREREAGAGVRKAAKKALEAGPRVPKDSAEPCVVEEGAALPANLRGTCYTK